MKIEIIGPKPVPTPPRTYVITLDQAELETLTVILGITSFVTARAAVQLRGFQYVDHLPIYMEMYKAMTSKE